MVGVDGLGAGEDVEPEVAAAFGPLVVLLGQHGTDEPDDAGPGGAPLSSSSRAEGGALDGGEVGLEGPVHDVCEVPLQAPAGFGGGLALGSFAGKVLARWWVPAGLDHCDGEQGPVELAVASGPDPGSRTRGWFTRRVPA